MTGWVGVGRNSGERRNISTVKRRLIIPTAQNSQQSKIQEIKNFKNNNMLALNLFICEGHGLISLRDLCPNLLQRGCLFDNKCLSVKTFRDTCTGT